MRVSWAPLLAVLAIGCSGEQSLGPVSGRVTIDGKPVTAGRVTFSAKDQSNAASGELTADGSYTIADAPTGDVVIAVRTRDYATILMPGSAKITKGVDGDSSVYTPSQKANPLYVATPDRFADLSKSGIEVTIPKSGPRPFVYDIQLAK